MAGQLHSPPCLHCDSPEHSALDCPFFDDEIAEEPTPAPPADLTVARWGGSEFPGGC